MNCKSFSVSLLACILLAGCIAPLPPLNTLTIDQRAALTVEQVADYCVSQPSVESEKLARSRGFSCDRATNLCWKSGLKEKDKGWSDCYIQATGIIAQSDAAEAARQSAAAAAFQSIQAQNAMVNSMNRPRTCYNIGNSVSCY